MIIANLANDNYLASLRDKLAGKAMQSLILEFKDADVIAHKAYMIADAMLKHRNKKQ